MFSYYLPRYPNVQNGLVLHAAIVVTEFAPTKAILRYKVNNNTK